MIFPLIDADELYHSKGQWLTHKYIRREGRSPHYKYYYGEKTSTGKQVGEEKEVFLTKTEKNKETGFIDTHHRDSESFDFREGQYFEDAKGNRVAKVHPFSKYGLEFYNTPHVPLRDVPVFDPKALRESGAGFISSLSAKLEPTYNYTNRAKGVDVTDGISEYALTPRRKRKPR